MNQGRQHIEHENLLKLVNVEAVFVGVWKSWLCLFVKLV